MLIRRTGKVDVFHDSYFLSEKRGKCKVVARASDIVLGAAAQARCSDDMRRLCVIARTH